METTVTSSTQNLLGQNYGTKKTVKLIILSVDKSILGPITLNHGHSLLDAI